MAEAHRDEIAKLEALHASNPEGRVFTHLAEAYRKAGETERARQILMEGLRRHPESASAYVVLGRVLSDSGDAEGGFDAFRRALELDTDNMVALRWCGDLAMRAGRVDDALGYYHKLIARDPSDANLRERVGIIEADRAAAMHATPEAAPATASPEGMPTTLASAEASLSLEGDALEDGFLPGQSEGDYDPGDLPGDLAAFAGRQMESCTGKPWTPVHTDDETAEAEVDAEMFAADGLLDLGSLGPSELDPDNYGIPLPASFEAPAEDVLDTGLLDTSFDADMAFDGGLSFDEGLPADDEPSLEGDDAAFGGDMAFDDGLLASPEAGSVDAPAAFDIPAETPAEPDYGWNPSEVEASAVASDPLDEVDQGGFGDAIGVMGGMGGMGGALPSGTAPITPATETMAELYRNQGFPERAAEVYQQLLRERGPDERLEQRLAEIEADLATQSAASSEELVLDQDDSGEMWLRDAESPWVDGGSVEESPDSPYVWSGDADDGASAGEPIGTYFRALLGWKGSAAAFTESVAPAVPEEPEIIYDDVVLLEDDAPAAAELMPWETAAPAAAEAPVAPEAPEAPLPTRVSEAPPVELMPWETAPAAMAAAPESVPEPTSGGTTEGSFASWYDEETGTGTSSGASNAGEDEGDDDEDLEMFRSWLQSLKK